MNITHAVDQLNDTGYLILESVLSDQQVAEMKAALNPYLQKENMGRNDFEGYKTERVYALLAKDQRLALLAEHPEVLPIVSHLLENDFLLSSMLAINIHPGETPQAFHADNAGFPFTQRTGLLGISTLWTLDDFTEENGATELIPGSHRWETPQNLNNKNEVKKAIKAIMPAGSVLIFSGSLYHRGGANQSSETRLAVTPQYCQPWLRQLESMLLAVPPEIARTYSEKLQGMLGYSVRAPGFMGHVDGLHPKRLLDPGYKGRRDRGLSS